MSFRRPVAGAPVSNETPYKGSNVIDIDPKDIAEVKDGNTSGLDELCRN